MPVWALGLSCETPAASGPPGRAPNVHIASPGAYQNSTRRHPERDRKSKNGGGRGKKKSAKILGPHPSGPHHDTHQQNGLANNGLAKIGLAKKGLAKIVQIRMAKTGLAKVGPFRRDGGRGSGNVCQLGVVFWKTIMTKNVTASGNCLL